MEKGYLHWKSDILTEFDPFETGLDRFVAMQKGDFIGKDALSTRPQTKKLRTLVLESSDAPAHGGASVMLGDKIVGTVTSGDWGHRVGKNLAYAFVDRDIDASIGLVVDVLGDLVPASIADRCLYDPKNERCRA